MIFLNRISLIKFQFALISPMTHSSRALYEFFGYILHWQNTVLRTPLSISYFTISSKNTVYVEMYMSSIVFKIIILQVLCKNLFYLVYQIEKLQSNPSRDFIITSTDSHLLIEKKTGWTCLLFIHVTFIHPLHTFL